MADVVVFGGSSGIGEALVARLVARGDRVVSIARRPCRVAGAHSLACDVSHTSQRQGVVARAKAMLGGLDAVVYAAGIAHHEAPVTEAGLRDTLEVNLVAALLCAEEALVALEPSGSLLFVASNLASRPLSNSAAYSASKAGLVAAAKALAQRGTVRVNIVSPGLVDTPMLAGRTFATSPMPPDHVATAILAALEQPSLNGAEIVLDGGASLDWGAD